MNFLPDTNVLIDYFEGRESGRIFLKEFLLKHDLFVSPITIAELRPKTTQEDQEKLSQFLDKGESVAVDMEIALEAGKYRAQFSIKTKKVYIVDCLIAATCKIHNLTLVTNNVKDYPMKDIKILKPS